MKAAFVRTIATCFRWGRAWISSSRAPFQVPNPGATLGTLLAYAARVPVEEYIFYFTGFTAVC